MWNREKVGWGGVVVLSAIVVLACASLSLGRYSGGAGEPNDPYLIGTPNDLNDIGNHVEDFDKCFLMVNDINMAEYIYITALIAPDVNDSINRFQGTTFTGVFDGNGHVISNLTIDDPTIDYIGLFGYIGEGSEVRNLGLDDVNIAGDSYVGTLVGCNFGKVTNCSSNGTVSGYEDIGGLIGMTEYGSFVSNCSADVVINDCIDSAGGFVGYNFYGTISNCYSSGAVNGDHTTYSAGGLVGFGRGGTITNSYATGKVTGNCNVGGLVGNNETYIWSCFATGDVNCMESGGGLVGRSESAIINCYALGNVFAEWGAGGLTGWDIWGGAMNCYSAGAVTGMESVGGLVGYKGSVKISNCFWDKETSGQIISAGGVGKTTSEMKSAFTYLDWGCGSVWTISDGNDYPHLAWENREGDLIEFPEEVRFLGSGTESEPYLIGTAEQLKTVGLCPSEWDKHFELIEDITLAEYDSNELNTIGNIGLGFKGVFDGNGHTVSDFKYRDNGEGCAGLFGCVKDTERETTPLIRDLGLIMPDVNSSTGKYVGSLVGSLGWGAIVNCYSQGGQVLGGNFVGGLVGYNYYSTVIGSFSTASVSGPSSVGGLVGRIQGFGEMGIIEDSYAKGDVSGSGWVGGLVGFLDGGYVKRCYSIGVVSFETLGGGLIGSPGGTVSACFWDVEASDCNTSGSGTGLTTAQMQDPNTFISTGWDFVGETVNGTDDVWDICDGTNYPRLVWSIPASDFLCPDGVNGLDFAYFASWWMEADCDSKDDCGGADLDFSGVVDWWDLKIFCDWWLEGGQM